MFCLADIACSNDSLVVVNTECHMHEDHCDTSQLTNMARMTENGEFMIQIHTDDDEYLNLTCKQRAL